MPRAKPDEPSMIYDFFVRVARRNRRERSYRTILTFSQRHPRRYLRYLFSAKAQHSAPVRHRRDSPWRTWGSALGLGDPKSASAEGAIHFCRQFVPLLASWLILFSQNCLHWPTLCSHEGNSGNAAGWWCFVSNDALDRRFACSGDGVSGIRSRGSLRILRSLLATALQFSSAPRSFLR